MQEVFARQIVKWPHSRTPVTDYTLDTVRPAAGVKAVPHTEGTGQFMGITANAKFAERSQPSIPLSRDRGGRLPGETTSWSWGTGSPQTSGLFMASPGGLADIGAASDSYPAIEIGITLGSVSRPSCRSLFTSWTVVYWAWVQLTRRMASPSPGASLWITMARRSSLAHRPGDVGDPAGIWIPLQSGLRCGRKPTARSRSTITPR